MVFGGESEVERELKEGMKGKKGEVFCWFVRMEKVRGGVEYRGENGERGEIYIGKEMWKVEVSGEERERVGKGEGVYVEKMMGGKGEELWWLVKVDMNRGRRMY